jgi:hypothetical protein
MRVLLDGIKRDYAQGGKERLSPLAIKSIDSITAIDPDSMWSRVANQETAQSALLALKDQMADSANNALRGAGVKGTWRPSRADEPVGLHGKTLQEATADGEGGIGAKVIGRIEYPITGPPDAFEGAAGRVGAQGQTSNYGLDPDDESKLIDLVKRSRRAGNAAYGDIVNQLKAPLESDRAGLAPSVARLLRDEDPGLLDDVLKAMPKMRADEVRAQITRPDLGGGGGGPAAGGSPGAGDAGPAAARVPGGGLPITPELGAVLQGLSPSQREAYVAHLRTMGFGR